MKCQAGALEHGSTNDEADNSNDDGDDDATSEAPPTAAGLAFGGHALVRQNKKNKK